MAGSYADLMVRIWEDERGMPPETRELAFAIAYVLHCEPGRPLWERATELLGTTRSGSKRIGDCVIKDAPRYEPCRVGGPGPCEGPRVRPYQPRRQKPRCLVSSHHPHLGDCQFTTIQYAWLDGTVRTYPSPDHHPPATQLAALVCGARGTIKVTEYDLVTGWQTSHWFCSRHTSRAQDVKAQLSAAGEPPEPVPNTGGLLPRYFATDWANIYQHYCDKHLRPWKTPYYGVDADGWPAPGMTLIPRRPRLSIVAS